MQYRIFTIPIFEGQAQQEEMNAFLRAHRVAVVEKQLVQSGAGAVYVFCVSYIEGGTPTAPSKEKVDYSKVLNATQYELFQTLRGFRKQVANHEAIPSYSVCTDAELAEVAQMREITIEKVHQLQCFVKNKPSRYFDMFISDYLASLVQPKSITQDSGIPF